MRSTVLDFTRPHTLRSEEEYELAVQEIDRLLELDPQKGSEDLERLEFFTLLVEDYESKHIQIQASSPQEMVNFMLEQKGMDRRDLELLMGGKSRVSEFFRGSRRLSMRQLIALRDALGIPADLLLPAA